MRLFEQGQLKSTAAQAHCTHSQCERAAPARAPSPIALPHECKPIILVNPRDAAGREAAYVCAHVLNAEPWEQRGSAASSLTTAAPMCSSIFFTHAARSCFISSYESSSTAGPIRRRPATRSRAAPGAERDLAPDPLVEKVCKLASVASVCWCLMGQVLVEGEAHIRRGAYVDEAWDALGSMLCSRCVLNARHPKRMWRDAAGSAIAPFDHELSASKNGA